MVLAGGLHVIGTERHESRRIDNQVTSKSKFEKSQLSYSSMLDFLYCQEVDCYLNILSLPHLVAWSKWQARGSRKFPLFP